MPRWLAIDPGEDTGLSIWEGESLVSAHTIKLWRVADLLDHLVCNDVPVAEENEDIHEAWVDGRGEIERVVCEDFRIYPWKAKDLAWDQVRTARLIGALTFLCHKHDVEFILQPAKIKERAVAGGAEELFSTPLHENRHANDSIMHGSYYVQVVLNGVSNSESAHSCAHHPV